MKVTYNTIRNTKQVDKPNEDIVLCDIENNIFILLDGVSRDNEEGKYPNPSPAVEVTGILSYEIYREILRQSIYQDDICSLILHGIQEANKKVQEYNKLNELSFAAGAVGIVSIIKNNVLYYAYIGDCYGRILYKDEMELFTKCQTELISKHKKEFSSFEIRNIICNNAQHPYAYGVLNGDSQAIEFLQIGQIELYNIDSIILSSDGMEDYLSKCTVEQLRGLDAIELVERAVLHNNERQDDRAIIKIQIVSNEL